MKIAAAAAASCTKKDESDDQIQYKLEVEWNEGREQQNCEGQR